MRAGCWAMPATRKKMSEAATRTNTKVLVPERKNALGDPAGYSSIRDALVGLLQSARQTTVRTVNTLMTATYWEIGRRIVVAEQGGKRKADYGDILVKRLGADLSARLGRGFGWRNLFQMRAFYLAWSDILQTPSAKLDAIGADRKLQTPSAISAMPLDLAAIANRFPLPWSAYVRLLSVKNEHARAFYETEVLRCGWSVRQLDRQIASQFYERTAASRNKANRTVSGWEWA